LKTRDFAVVFPKWRILIEPIYAFTFYILTLDRPFYKPALISWGAWGLYFVLLYCICKKKTIVQTLVRTLYAILLMASMAAFVVLVPLDGPKLVKPSKYIAVDFHSHSRYSHDNASTERGNFNFHISAGYDYFFITEHQNTNSFIHFSQPQREHIFPGIQMQVVEGVSVLLLSPRPFDAADYQNMSIVDIIQKAHKNDMLVVMPHWWKWEKFSFEQLKNYGIDGFEIYNSGYRNFKPSLRRDMIDFCLENNLLMIGSTDWHGWGYMSDVWTVFDAKGIINSKGNLEFGEPQVLVYRQAQSSALFRFIFEPFAAYYYYIKNVDMVNTFSFMVWFSAVFLVLFFSFAKVIFRFVPLILCGVCAVSALYYLAIFIPVSEVNNALPFIVIPSLAGLSAMWWLVWRMYEKTL
jgi:hypothetical protein